ncbi:YbhN family protein [Candidatus Omnitrophota bacterium]
MINKTRNLLLRMFFSLFLLALLLWLGRKNFATIGQLLSTINIFKFALAVAVLLAGMMFMAMRLKIILSVQEVNFKIKELFSLTLIGYFFSNFMPTSVGGDLIKGYYISKRAKTKSAAYASIFIDRLIGMSSLALIAAFALIVSRKQVGHGLIFWAVGLLCGLCLLFALLLSNRGLTKKAFGMLGLLRLLQALKLDQGLRRVYGYVNIYVGHKKKLLRAFVLSAIAQFVSFTSVYLLSVSLATEMPFIKIILFMPLIAVLCMLPITMNGLGLREWGFVFFLSPQIGPAAAFSMSILYLATFLVLSIIGGVVYLLRR